MWVYIVGLLIRVIRWLLINCLIKPLMERFVVRPLYGMLVEDGMGDVLEEDAELGGEPVSGGVLEDTSEGEDDIV